MCTLYQLGKFILCLQIFIWGMEVKLDFIPSYELDSIAISVLLVHMELCHPKVHALLFPLVCAMHSSSSFPFIFLFAKEYGCCVVIFGVIVVLCIWRMEGCCVVRIGYGTVVVLI
jgi:hypothetical protein